MPWSPAGAQTCAVVFRRGSCVPRGRKCQKPYAGGADHANVHLLCSTFRSIQRARLQSVLEKPHTRYVYYICARHDCVRPARSSSPRWYWFAKWFASGGGWNGSFTHMLNLPGVCKPVSLQYEFVVIPPARAFLRLLLPSWHSRASGSSTEMP